MLQPQYLAYHGVTASSKYPADADSEPAYRTKYSEIVVSPDGRLPARPDSPLATAEYDHVAERMESAWSAVGSLQPGAPVPPCSGPARMERAWRVWMLSHHAFIPIYCMLAATYDEMVDTATQTSSEAATRLATLAKQSAQLNSAAGCLLEYGIDFDSTAEVYARIRAKMPEGFSGFWMREAVAVADAHKRWTAANKDNPFSSATAIEREGRRRYHELHVDVMHRAVPGGQSLRKEYEVVTHQHQMVSDREFEAYDEWFRLKRKPITFAEFAVTTATVVVNVADDISCGSLLPTATVRELKDGLKAVLVALGAWLGPMPLTSNFYPKSYRGE